MKVADPRARIEHRIKRQWRLAIAPCNLVLYDAFVRTRILVTLWLLLAMAHTALADVRIIRVRWPELDGLVLDKQVSIFTTAGQTLKGRVSAIDAGAILLSGKTPRVARADVAEIRITDYAGNGRRIGKLVGGAVGLTAGLIGAVAVGMDETSSHKGRDKAIATISAVGGLPAGLAAGYYLGRQADKQVAIIRIVN